MDILDTKAPLFPAVLDLGINPECIFMSLLLLKRPEFEDLHVPDSLGSLSLERSNELTAPFERYCTLLLGLGATALSDSCLLVHSIRVLAQKTASKSVMTNQNRLVLRKLLLDNKC